MTRPPRPTTGRASVWNKQRETWVSVYDGIESGLDTDGGRWQVACEKHGSILSVETRKQARVEMNGDPAEFCEECNA